MFLSVQMCIMILVGKWYIGFNNKIIDMIYKLYSFVVESFFLLMTQLLLISIIVFKECPERVMELICYYIQYTNSNMCSFLSKREKMKRIYNYIIEYENEHLNPSVSHIYLEFAVMNRRVIQFFLLLTAAGGTLWYVLVVKDSYGNNTSFCLVEKGLNFQIWYPFNLYNKCYPITLVADILFYLSAVFVHIYNKISPVTFIIFTLGQIKILEEMLRRLQYINCNRDLRKAVIDCAKAHQEVIRLTNLIDSACNEIVLIGFFTNSLELAAFVIKLLMEENIFGALRTIGILCMTITQLFMFFWFANELQVQSTTISDVIYYETNWLNYDTENRQHLLLMMVRSQRPLTIKAAAIGDMSLDVFKRIMKLCYSTATFFKTVYM